jgi:hypothetical protein
MPTITIENIASLVATLAVSDIEFCNTFDESVTAEAGPPCLCLSEAKLGIPPAVIGPYRSNGVGKLQGRHLAPTAERHTTTEQLVIGLMQRLVPATELDQAV